MKDKSIIEEIKVMKNLRPLYSKERIFSRLGYHKAKTRLSYDDKDRITRVLVETEKTMNITAAYRIINISGINAPHVFLEDGVKLAGQKLCGLLNNCDKALLMLATGGHMIMEKISKLQAEGKMSEAVIMDAAASEIVDSALDMIMAHVGNKLRHKGKAITRMRFSPGYGDFDITQQVYFYSLLNASSFDIMLNEAYLLIPEKSVFAIAGIGRA
jgi:hypothetical protein